MTRYLTAPELLYIHQRVIERTGGSAGVRDKSLLEATLHRPRAARDAIELYPSLAQKGAVLMYSLVLNHLFLDGNKRVGLQALDVFLRLNGMRLAADADSRCEFLQDVAAETLGIEAMAAWIETHVEPYKGAPPSEARPGGSRQRVSRRVTIRPPEGF